MSEKLKNTISEASQVFILTDENVAPFWLPETEYWLGCENAVEIVMLDLVQHLCWQILKPGPE